MGVHGLKYRKMRNRIQNIELTEFKTLNSTSLKI